MYKRSINTSVPELWPSVFGSTSSVAAFVSSSELLSFISLVDVVSLFSASSIVELDLIGPPKLVVSIKRIRVRMSKFFGKPRPNCSK